MAEVPPAAAPQEARFNARHDSEVPRETRVRRQRAEVIPPHHAPASEIAGEEGIAGGRPQAVHAPALLPAGEGETAPVAPRPPPALPPAPAEEAHGTPAAGEVKSVPEPAPQILAAPAIIAPAGDQLAVRLKRSAVAAFLRQVEGRIAHHWFPQEVYTRVDPGGNISGVERRTAMKVRVRADGTLERLEVESSSGVPALDEEAKAAFQRAQPFAHPPAMILDEKGGLTFPFAVSLDLEMARWKSDVKRLVGAGWRPRDRLYIDRDRVTILRALLTFEGVVAHVSVESSSGSGFLDGSTLSALTEGMRLPRPPHSLGEVAGVVPVRIAFLHRFRGEHDVQIMAEVADE
jgi:TonB family protein